MRAHPLADIFPLLGGTDLQSLADDIKANGQQQDIWTLDGMILDGRNRYKACQIAGVTPRLREYTNAHPERFVVSLNLHRRHLNESQRALVANKLATLKDGLNQRFAEGAPIGAPSKDASIEASAPVISQPEAAALLGVSRRAVQRARAVEEQAAPELIQSVERGEVSLHAALQVAKLAEPQQRVVVEQGPVAVKETASDIANNRPIKALETNNHRAIGTGVNEWYTPAEYIAAAREVFGEIDLDPASCIKANETVKAKAFFTESFNGLEQKWHGNVWLNPPYSQPQIQQFIEKAVASYIDGDIGSCIILTHNYTDTRWFSAAWNEASAICFTRGRIGFISPDGVKASPTQGQAFFYLGKNPEKFLKVFGKFGPSTYVKN